MKHLNSCRKVLVVGLMIGIAIGIPRSALADQAAQLFVSLAAVMGSTVALTGAGMEGLLPFELKDWKDSRTESTAQLTQNCGVAAELRLIGNNRGNFIVAGLRNSSQAKRFIKPGEVRMTFSTGRERMADYPSTQTEAELKEGSTAIGIFAFPEKSDFKKAEWIDVDIPIFDENKKSACTIHGRLTHNPTRAFRTESTTVYSAFEVEFGLGATLWRSSQLRALGGNSALVDLGLIGFPSVHHGIAIRLTLDTFSGVDQNALSAAGGLSPSSDNRVLLGVGIFAGYVHRDLWSDRWTFTQEADLGIRGFGYSAPNESGLNSSSFALSGRLNWAYRFLRVDHNWFWRGDYSIGLSLFDMWAPAGSFTNAISTSGHTFGSALEFKVGY